VFVVFASSSSVEAGPHRRQTTAHCQGELPKYYMNGYGKLNHMDFQTAHYCHSTSSHVVFIAYPIWAVQIRKLGLERGLGAVRTRREAASFEVYGVYPFSTRYESMDSIGVSLVAFPKRYLDIVREPSSLDQALPDSGTLMIRSVDQIACPRSSRSLPSKQLRLRGHRTTGWYDGMRPLEPRDQAAQARQCHTYGS